MTYSIRSTINDVLENYLGERENKTDWTDHPLNILRNVRDAVKNTLDDEIVKNLTIEGSIGMINPNWAEVPWLKIAMKNPDVHKDSGHGYFLMYIFDSEMNGFYLSLIQGMKYYNKNYSNSKTAQNKADSVSQKVRDIILSRNNYSELVTVIKLNGKNDTAKSYEKAHIIGKYYSAKNLPDESILATDLNFMLSLYNDLASLVKVHTFEGFNEKVLLNDDGLYIELDNEIDYQEASNNYSEVIEEDNYQIIPREKKALIKSLDLKTSYPRDVKQAATALEVADYQCEFDSNLPTFINKRTNKNFVEGHHLIPIEYHNKFEFDIDIPANIIALNPIIHRQIHHGLNNDRVEILKQLYSQRKDLLKRSGLEITFEELKEMYFNSKES